MLNWETNDFGVMIICLFFFKLSILFFHDWRCRQLAHEERPVVILPCEDPEYEVGKTTHNAGPQQSVKVSPKGQFNSVLFIVIFQDILDKDVCTCARAGRYSHR